MYSNNVLKPLVMLKFDAESNRILDDAYQGSDAVRMRRANFEALRVRPGDDVLDIGYGTDLLTSELARGVGHWDRSQ